MNLAQLLDSFTSDKTAMLILWLIPIDLAFGIFAAIKDKAQSFRLSYVSDFLRTDVLGKAVPYFMVWATIHVAGFDFSVISPQFDVLEETAGALAIAALGGSLLNSLRDIGLFVPKKTSDTFAGPDPVTPG